MGRAGLFLSSTTVNCKLEGLARAKSYTRGRPGKPEDDGISLQHSTPRREPVQQVCRRWWIGGKAMRSPGHWLPWAFGLRLSTGESVTINWMRCWLHSAPPLTEPLGTN
jgi:hypothetical protein